MKRCRVKAATGPSPSFARASFRGAPIKRFWAQSLSHQKSAFIHRGSPYQGIRGGGCIREGMAEVGRSSSATIPSFSATEGADQAIAVPTMASAPSAISSKRGA